MTALILLTLVTLVALLLAEFTDSHVGVWIAKPVASLGFLAVAVEAGGLDSIGAFGSSGSRYDFFVLLGLVLSWWGDFFLIPVDRPAIFRAGLASFLMAHVAYVLAFVSLGLQPLATGVAALLLVGPVLVVLRWLRPNLSAEMRIPVYLYMAVITLMVICASGAVAAGGRPLILLGATMFYVSDLAVARDRFIAPGFNNRVWGLPLYYGAQLVLATTITG